MGKTAQMTHKERLIAATKKQDVDYVPFDIWQHYPYAEQDPIYLAEVQLEVAKKFNFDFIKFMPDAFVYTYDFGISSYTYTSLPNPQKTQFRKSLIRTLDDWKAIKPLSANTGSLYKAISITKYMQRFQKEQGVEIPYVVTVNSPLTNLLELGPDAHQREGDGPTQTLKLLREYPEIFHEVLEKLTQTAIDYIRANLEYGPAGFFFATRYASSKYMTEEEYDEFGTKYDMRLFDEFKDKTYFNMLHIHGPDTYWKKIADFPGNVVNWHDAWIPPTLQDARKMTNKCLNGGLNERELYSYTPQKVKEIIIDAVERAGRRGFIIGNGCGVWPNVLDDNMAAIRDTAMSL